MNYRYSNYIKVIVITWLYIVNLSVIALSDEALLKEASGGVSIVDSNDTDICLESEVVKIKLDEKTYTVDATFEFFNYGKTITLMVGFPNYGYGYSNAFYGVKDNNSFETWVNGEKYSFRYMQGEMKISQVDFYGTKHEVSIIDNDEIQEVKNKLKNKQILELSNSEISSKGALMVEETQWFVKEVNFEGNKKTITRVRYSAEYSTMSYLEYLYGTGRTWKDSIGKATFIIESSPGVWVKRVGRFVSDANPRDFTINRLSEYEHEYILTFFEPEENEVFRLFVSSSEQPWEVYGNFIYENKYLSDNILHILSLWQLRLIRNAFFALHGKEFISPELDTAFRKTYWYKPKKDFKYSNLSKVEMENVKKIFAYEQKIKELFKSK